MTTKQATATARTMDGRKAAAAALSDKELDAVSGGGMLFSAVSNVIKAVGQSLSTAARG